MASLVDENGALAPHGLADELKRQRLAIERGRMKLDKFEIGQGRARLRREGQPFAPRANGIGAILEQAADSACRDDGALRSENRGAADAFGENSCHAVVFDEQPPRRETLDQGDRARFARKTGQWPHDFASAGIAAGMNDPPPRVRRFEAKGKFALAVAVERHATPDQFADRGRRGFEDRARDRFVAETIAGLERIGEMQRKIVVRPNTRGNPALGEDARGFNSKRRFAEEDYRPGRQAKSGGQARQTAAYDDACPRAVDNIHQCTASMRSTARRAGAAISGRICTSCCIVSSARRILRSVIFFICGQRLQGRMNSSSGSWIATLSLIEHSVKSTTRAGRFLLT